MQQPKTDQTKQPATSRVPVGISSGGKELEAVPTAAHESIQQISHEVIIPEEVEKAGVVVTQKAVVELPPDVKKLGVTATGASHQVTVSALPQIVLPISDQKVMAGLHMKLTSALHWLAIWCLRKLKKAHIMLKIIHGKIVRVKLE